MDRGGWAALLSACPLLRRSTARSNLEQKLVVQTCDEQRHAELRLCQLHACCVTCDHRLCCSLQARFSSVCAFSNVRCRHRVRSANLGCVQCVQAAAAAAERRARDSVWCPCSRRGGFLSAEDAIIMEDMPAPAPCRSGAGVTTFNPKGASASPPRLRDDARHSRRAAAPQERVDLTLSDDDGAHPAASQGAFAPSPEAEAGAPNAGALCGAAKESGVAAPELLQNGPKRQRPESQAKAGVYEAEMSKGQTGAVIQLGASAESVSGESLSGACMQFPLL